MLKKEENMGVNCTAGRRGANRCEIHSTEAAYSSCWYFGGDWAFIYMWQNCIGFSAGNLLQKEETKYFTHI